MTDDIEAEARAEATEKAFPESEWTQRATVLWARGAFQEGWDAHATWQASRPVQITDWHQRAVRLAGWVDAVLDALGDLAHPRNSGNSKAYYKAASLAARWINLLASDVTEDEREAEDFIDFDAWERDYFGPVQITDDMVERAASAGFEHIRAQRPADHGPYPGWDSQTDDYRNYLRGIARAELEAALNPRQDENQEPTP